MVHLELPNTFLSKDPKYIKNIDNQMMNFSSSFHHLLQKTAFIIYILLNTDEKVLFVFFPILV